MEGTRPLLVEVQALVAPTEIVPPRRTATGVDRNRLALVLAVLTRHGGISLSAADVFVNVAGGIRVDEPGADLAIALAVASAHSGRALESDGKPLACFGELGLTGEIRYVAHADRRVAEARKFGLGHVLGPPPGDEAIPGLSRWAVSRRRCPAGGAELRPRHALARVPMQGPRLAWRMGASATGPARQSGLTSAFPTSPHGFPRKARCFAFCFHQSRWRLRFPATIYRSWRRDRTRDFCGPSTSSPRAQRFARASTTSSTRGQAD